MIKYLFIALVSLILCAASSKIWECNYCHQQYVGDNPPRFTKCPEKNNKQNHWWIRKN